MNLLLASGTRFVLTYFVVGHNQQNLFHINVTYQSFTDVLCTGANWYSIWLSMLSPLKLEHTIWVQHYKNKDALQLVIAWL